MLVLLVAIMVGKLSFITTRLIGMEPINPFVSLVFPAKTISMTRKLGIGSDDRYFFSLIRSREGWRVISEIFEPVMEQSDSMRKTNFYLFNFSKSPHLNRAGTAITSIKVNSIIKVKAKIPAMLCCCCRPS